MAASPSIESCGFDGVPSDPRLQNCNQRRFGLSGGPLGTKRPAASWSCAVAATSSSSESSIVLVSPGSYVCLSAIAAVRFAISYSTLTQASLARRRSAMPWRTTNPSNTSAAIAPATAEAEEMEERLDAVNP